MVSLVIRGIDKWYYFQFGLVMSEVLSMSAAGLVIPHRNKWMLLALTATRNCTAGNALVLHEWRGEMKDHMCLFIQIYLAAVTYRHCLTVSLSSDNYVSKY